MSRKSKYWSKKRRQDQYYRRAKSTGYRSRASYKLKQINTKYKILKEGQTVIDLGCAPGGWSQVAAEVVGPEGLVIGVDRDHMRPLDGVHFIRGDLTAARTQQKIRDYLTTHRREPSDPANDTENGDDTDPENSADHDTKTGASTDPVANTQTNTNTAQQEPDRPPLVDVIISDMSPNISGNYSVDQARSVYLVECAFEFAQTLLKPRGCFIAKVFQGEDFQALYQRLNARFRSFHGFDPPASRKKSSEMYLVGKGFKPTR